ncbi:hypothetical protein GS08_06440 [Bifidobacterium longum]|uniref:Uncharacterized protein n=1 Tax=Bifidobacterium longum TaxID=216816 RepID=A0A7U4H658_BIFLN|nr:hypothetical protein GS08_06440 [Bifidobacterium longum]RHM32983.1 hypothetical protein DWZ71_08230 [Bifidobacterium longum]
MRIIGGIIVFFGIIFVRIIILAHICFISRLYCLTYFFIALFSIVEHSLIFFANITLPRTRRTTTSMINNAFFFIAGSHLYSIFQVTALLKIESTVRSSMMVFRRTKTGRLL